MSYPDAPVIARLSDPRYHRVGGPCGLAGCGRPGVTWQGRATPAGLRVGALACEAHPVDVSAALACLTIDEIVALVPRHQRRTRAAAARRRALRLEGRPDRGGPEGIALRALALALCDSMTTIRVDGEEAGDLGAMLAANPGLSDDDVAALRALRPGETYIGGGGAGAEWEVTRTR